MAKCVRSNTAATRNQIGHQRTHIIMLGSMIDSLPTAIKHMCIDVSYVGYKEDLRLLISTDSEPADLHDALSKMTQKQMDYNEKLLKRYISKLDKVMIDRKMFQVAKKKLEKLNSSEDAISKNMKSMARDILFEATQVSCMRNGDRSHDRLHHLDTCKFTYPRWRDDAARADMYHSTSSTEFYPFLYLMKSKELHYQKTKNEIKANAGSNAICHSGTDHPYVMIMQAEKLTRGFVPVKQSDHNLPFDCLKNAGKSQSPTSSIITLTTISSDSFVQSRLATYCTAIKKQVGPRIILAYSYDGCKGDLEVLTKCFNEPIRWYKLLGECGEKQKNYNRRAIREVFDAITELGVRVGYPNCVNDLLNAQTRIKRKFKKNSIHRALTPETNNFASDLLFEITEKQRLFVGDRHHPRLLDLDSLRLKYPGWKDDELIAEKLHFKSKRAKFYQRLNDMIDKEREYLLEGKIKP